MTITKLKIRLYGDPCLRKKSISVKDIGPSERLLIKSMLETMYAYKGIGLAAPQVGINQRILVADIGDGPVVIINPVIVRKSGNAVMEEGCLSIPGINVDIRRAERIIVKYLDHNNRLVERHFHDLMARVILHETDHLNGKLIIDYASFTQRRKLKKQLEEIENQNPSDIQIKASVRDVLAKRALSSKE